MTTALWSLGWSAGGSEGDCSEAVELWAGGREGRPTASAGSVRHLVNTELARPAPLPCFSCGGGAPRPALAPSPWHSCPGRLHPAWSPGTTPAPVSPGRRPRKSQDLARGVGPPVGVAECKASWERLRDQVRAAAVPHAHSRRLPASDWANRTPDRALQTPRWSARQPSLP